MEEILKEILEELKAIKKGIQVIESNSNPTEDNQNVETLVNIVKKVNEHNEYISSLNKYLVAIQKSHLDFRFDESL